MIGHRKQGAGWLRFAEVWLIASAFLVGTVALPKLHAAEVKTPTLFYNDTAWAMDMYYPSLGYIIGGTEDFWIPLSFYEEIADMRVRRGAAKNHTVFVIQDTETEKYLSFNINDSSYAQTERGTLLLVNTMLYSKERYLPMREMCRYFGWTFEISDDHKSVRICDGGQKKQFSELLAVYAPPTADETETTDAPVTEPVTEPVDQPQDGYRSATVYLTFEDIEDTNTPVLLDTLAAHKAKATFFVSGEQMSEYPDLVLRIITEGHALGLHGMNGDEYSMQKTEDILASFDEENELLYALIRRKVRLIRCPNGSRSGRLVLTDAQKTALLDAGYIMWDWNISAMDHDPAYSADMVLAKIDAAMKSSYYPVIRMHCTAAAAEALEPLLLRLENAGTTPAAIALTDTPVVFP